LSYLCLNQILIRGQCLQRHSSQTLKFMCVIIIKQKGKDVPREVLKTSARINPHGLGIVWLDTFEVTYHKSKEYSTLDTDRPYIAHFRYATIGKVCKENTHPFVCGKNKDELFMMNGTINGYGNQKMTDTEDLAIGKVRGKVCCNQHSQSFVPNLQQRVVHVS